MNTRASQIRESVRSRFNENLNYLHESYDSNDLKVLFEALTPGIPEKEWQTPVESGGFGLQTGLGDPDHRPAKLYGKATTKMGRVSNYAKRFGKSAMLGFLSGWFPGESGKRGDYLHAIDKVNINQQIPQALDAREAASKQRSEKRLEQIRSSASNAEARAKQRIVKQKGELPVPRYMGFKAVPLPGGGERVERIIHPDDAKTIAQRETDIKNLAARSRLRAQNAVRRQGQKRSAEVARETEIRKELEGGRFKPSGEIPRASSRVGRAVGKTGKYALGVGAGTLALAGLNVLKKGYINPVLTGDPPYQQDMDVFGGGGGGGGMSSRGDITR